MEFRYSGWKGGRICEKLRKLMIDVCCLLEERRSGLCVRMQRMK